MDHDGPPALRHNQDTLLALRTALKHDQVATDPEVVCSIVQACRDWRAAVKTSDAGLLKIQLDGWRSKPTDLENFVALGRWITEFPGSIGSLDVRGSPDNGAHNFRTAAESALADNIELATAGPLAEGHRCNRQLKLRSLVSINLGGERLLSALPAAYLVQLELHVPHPAGDSRNGNNSGSGDTKWLAAVRRLSNLQQLQLSAGDILPLGTLAATQALQHLTYLQLTDVDVGDAADLQLLPAQLKQLKMSLTTNTPPHPSQLQLQHLTQLERLKLGMADFDVLPGSQLPPNITTLKMTGFVVQEGDAGVYPLLEHINIAGLCELQKLRLNIRDDAGTWSLDPLMTMKHLTTVSLDYKSLTRAADAAPAWGSVPALQQLTLSNGHNDEQLDEVNFTTLMEGIRAATKLSSLDIDFADSDGLPVTVEQLQLCSYLTGLSNLRELKLTFTGSSELSNRDMLHLTALTALTKLGVTWAPAPAVDGLTAVALACRLTNLVRLDLSGSNSECLAAIPAIALHLTRLEYLDLSYIEALDDSSFLMLTTLRNLTHFSPHYHEEYAPSYEAWKTFWNLVRA